MKPERITRIVLLSADYPIYNAECIVPKELVPAVTECVPLENGNEVRDLGNAYVVCLKLHENYIPSAEDRRMLPQVVDDEEEVKTLLAICRTAFPSQIGRVRAQIKKNYLKRFPQLRYGK